jgi:hypothetical protein
MARKLGYRSSHLVRSRPPSSDRPEGSWSTSSMVPLRRRLVIDGWPAVGRSASIFVLSSRLVVMRMFLITSASTRA